MMMAGSRPHRPSRPDLLVFLGAVALLLIGQLPVRAASHSSPDAGPSQEDSQDSEITNEWCPVLMDEPVDPEIFTEYRGARVFLCCRKCLKQFRADPEAFAGNLPALASSVAVQDTAGAGSHPDDHQHGEETEDGHGSGSVDTVAGAVEHDHADHDDGDVSGLGGVIRWFGRLHPMIVHFPIALLLMAAAAELLSVFTGTSGFAFAARFCLWGGALAAAVAAPLGWADASAVADGYAGFSARLLFFHRWVGTATAVVAGVALFACERDRRGGGDSWKGPYRALLFLCALLVSVAGHLGASLIYGWEYLSW